MPDNTVRLMCPNLVCRSLLSVPESARGKTVKCGACATNMRVPLPGENKIGSNKSNNTPDDFSKEEKL